MLKCITATAMNSFTLLMKSQTLSSDEDAVEAAVAAEKGQGADYVAGVELPGGAPYAIDPNAPACNEEQEAALQKMLRWLQIAHQAKQPLCKQVGRGGQGSHQTARMRARMRSNRCVLETRCPNVN